MYALVADIVHIVIRLIEGGLGYVSAAVRRERDRRRRRAPAKRR